LALERGHESNTSAISSFCTDRRRGGAEREIGARRKLSDPPRSDHIRVPARRHKRTYARLIAQWLSEHLGQQFFVENRAGAGGTLAAEAVARSAPDGYMLHLTTSADAWNASLYDKLNFSVIRDFTPVATIARGPGVLVVHPSLAVKSVPELIAYAKSNPGKLTVASAGIGSAPHMYWE